MEKLSGDYWDKVKYKPPRLNYGVKDSDANELAKSINI